MDGDACGIGDQQERTLRAQEMRGERVSLNSEWSQFSPRMILSLVRDITTLLDDYHCGVIVADEAWFGNFGTSGAMISCTV